jgi:YgiT-type zinc finger domain-containing protein
MVCPKCRGPMVASEETFKREIAGMPLVITTPARKCSECGAVVVSSDDAEAGELAVASHLAMHGPISGASFSYMRRILGLSGVDVGRLLNIGAQTISRWENGLRDPDHSAWLTLGSMVLDAAAGRATTRARLGVLAEGPSATPVHVRGRRPPATIARMIALLTGPHLTDKEIAERIHVDVDTVVAALRRLKKHGLVVREDGTEIGDKWISIVPGGFDALLEATVARGIDVDEELATLGPAPKKRAHA